MDWITHALTRLHEEHRDLAVILAEILERQNEIRNLLKSEPKPSKRSMDLGKLFRPPAVWFLIGGAMWLLQFPLPLVIEVIKIGTGIP